MFEFLCPESDNRDSEYSRIIIIVIIIIIITRCLKTHFTTYEVSMPFTISYLPNLTIDTVKKKSF